MTSKRINVQLNKMEKLANLCFVLADLERAWGKNEGAFPSCV